MSIVLGVDIGISTTKIVGNSGEKRLDMLQVETAERSVLHDSLHNVINTYLSRHGLSLPQVSGIYMTGVGSSFLPQESFCGTAVFKMPEFDAIKNGALKMSGLHEALVVSMGTGTAFVRATQSRAVHIGGTGVGGGTVLGLAQRLINSTDIDTVLDLAAHGDAHNVDLLVKDILSGSVDTLAPDLTASNFGKLQGSASDADLALGILNMVFEIIGMMTLLALQKDSLDDAVLIGTLATVPHAKTVFGKFAEMSGKRFAILPDAAFVTALGTLPEHG